MLRIITSAISSCLACGICGYNGIEGLLSNNLPTQIWFRWLKPTEGWHKLNTNGSVVSTNGLSGCGGLLRDSAGQWVVGFAKSISVSSSIAAELWALRDGLGLCLERGISAVEIELDATTAISLVSSNVNANGDLSGVVDDCKELLLRLPQVKCYCIASGKQILVPML